MGIGCDGLYFRRVHGGNDAIQAIFETILDALGEGHHLAVLVAIHGIPAIGPPQGRGVGLAALGEMAIAAIQAIAHVAFAVNLGVLTKMLRPSFTISPYLSSGMSST
uniref:Uncharacterized protein n=1 Tax=Candidatus Kentrum sp. LFY TaxID=2126342 RepID=A0A450UUK5_9GAMM|nr:MAG: hypothetical protein BECKLFY1418A_GA0070994_10572 [Candidatus Kentron sp. LFY]